MLLLDENNRTKFRIATQFDSQCIHLSLKQEQDCYVWFEIVLVDFIMDNP
jgi:hypothetical protein